MSFEPIQSDQTDSGSPIDKQLMDQGLRLNMDALYASAALLGTIPQGGSVWVEDFLGRSDSTALTIGANLAYAVSGTGAAFSGFPTTTPADNQHVGVGEFTVGTTTTGYWSVLGLHFHAGNGEVIMETLVRVADLSTAGEEYALFFGGTQTPTLITAAEGIYIKYARGTSVNWIYNCRSASTGTEQVSSVAVTEDAWWRLRIVINAAASSVEFFAGVAGGALTSLGTVTTNIPTGFQAPTLLMKKSAGTTARVGYVDYMFFQKTISGGR